MHDLWTYQCYYRLSEPLGGYVPDVSLPVHPTLSCCLSQLASGFPSPAPWQQAGLLPEQRPGALATTVRLMSDGRSHLQGQP